MSLGIWNSTPTHDAVIFVLKKNQGVMIDQDLFKLLKNDYKNLTPKDLMITLLKLEVNGIIQVTRMVKNKNRIELTEKYR